MSTVSESNHTSMHDAIIIGGGPAGISCALELSYCGVKCLVICRDGRLGGQLWDMSGELVNFAGGYFQSASALAEQMEALAARTDILIEKNTAVDRIDAKKKIIYCGEREFKAKTILLSTGLRLKRMEFAGTENFKQAIIYRDDKDLAGYKGLSVAVLGGGDNALMKALDLAKVAQKVYLINRSKHWRARTAFLEEAKGSTCIEILEKTEIEKLHGDSTLKSAKLINRLDGVEKTVEIDRLFVKIGYSPNTEPFKGQIAMTESGYLIADGRRQTSEAAIFAAGDILAETCPRVATACGDGSLAAESILIHLGKRLTP